MNSNKELFNITKNSLLRNFQFEYSIRDIDSPSIRFYEIDTINLLGFQDTFEITVPVSPKKFYKRK